MINNFKYKDISHLLNRTKEKLKQIKPNRLKVATLTTASLGCFLFFNNFNNQLSANLSNANNQTTELGAFKVTVPTIKYGFALDTFNVTEEKVLPNQAFSKILEEHKIGLQLSTELTKKAKQYFDFTNLKAGKKYTILSKDPNLGADYFIYEPDKYRYIIMNFKGTPDVKEIKRTMVTKIMEASGTIDGSLWNTMLDNGLSDEVADQMESALKWSVDFHHMTDGDHFKVIYEQDFVENKPAKVGKVLAAYYESSQKDQEYYSFYHETENYKGYFTKEGRPQKAGFLKSPLKYSRISSGFNMKRLHPILGYVKPHFGTDYAAPFGTPIIAVSDGIVQEARYAKGNGNYIKLKHDATYQSQYLHMSRFAKGMRPGKHVAQGEIIGYVGSTGLATGPHVCFRFWKNGKQVNHLKEKLPPASIMDKKDLQNYIVVREELMTKLKKIPYLTKQQILANKQKENAASVKP